MTVLILEKVNFRAKSIIWEKERGTFCNDPVGYITERAITNVLTHGGFKMWEARTEN